MELYWVCCCNTQFVETYSPRHKLYPLTWCSLNEQGFPSHSAWVRQSTYTEQNVNMVHKTNSTNLCLKHSWLIELLMVIPLKRDLPLSQYSVSGKHQSCRSRRGGRERAHTKKKKERGRAGPIINRISIVCHWPSWISQLFNKNKEKKKTVNSKHIKFWKEDCIPLSSTVWVGAWRYVEWIYQVCHPHRKIWTTTEENMK